MIFPVTDQQWCKPCTSTLGALVFFLIAALQSYPVFHRKQGQAFQPCFTRPETSSNPQRAGRREPVTYQSLCNHKAFILVHGRNPSISVPPWAPGMFCSRVMHSKIWEFSKSWDAGLSAARMAFEIQEGQRAGSEVSGSGFAVPFIRAISAGLAGDGATSRGSPGRRGSQHALPGSLHPLRCLCPGTPQPFCQPSRILRPAGDAGVNPRVVLAILPFPWRMVRMVWMVPWHG